MPQDDDDGFVYFIGANDVARRSQRQSANTLRTKIGWAKDPYARLGELQTGSPVVLELRAFVPGTRIAEAEVHRIFASERLHGEWFDITRSSTKLRRQLARAPIDRNRMSFVNGDRPRYIGDMTMPTERTAESCDYCGSTLTGARKLRWCSPECARTWRRENEGQYGVCGWEGCDVVTGPSAGATVPPNKHCDGHRSAAASVAARAAAAISASSRARA